MGEGVCGVEIEREWIRQVMILLLIFVFLLLSFSKPFGRSCAGLEVQRIAWSQVTDGVWTMPHALRDVL